MLQLTGRRPLEFVHLSILKLLSIVAHEKGRIAMAESCLTTTMKSRISAMPAKKKKGPKKREQVSVAGNRTPIFAELPGTTGP